MTPLVSRDTRQGVAVLTLDHPPANGLEPAVIAQLDAAVQAALDDGDVTAIAIRGQGSGFASGPDLRNETARPNAALTALCRRLEDAPKPTVAVVQGPTIGQGLELALACHIRVADRDAHFAMPDVALGWLPAAGGIQRLTRVVGGKAALQILLGGKSFTAPRAQALGLLDILTDGDPLAAALARAREISPRPTRKRLDALIHRAEDLQAVKAARAKLLERPPGTPAPAAILECVEAALTADMASGFALEARLAARCAAAPATRALRHIFLARRSAARPERSVQPPESLLVTGFNGHAAHIAKRALMAGLEVTLLESSDRALTLSRAVVSELFAAELRAGKIAENARVALLERLKGTLDPIALSEAEVILAEDEVATAAAKIDPHTPVLLTQNTRAKAGIGVSGRWSPADLIEFLPGPQTSATAQARALGFARLLNQPSLLVPVPRDGAHQPLVARLEAAWLTAADLLLAKGLSVARIDSALLTAGWREGAFLHQDRLGIRMCRERLARVGLPGSSGVAAALIAAGETGQSAGKGYYVWANGAPVEENPKAQAAGDPQDISDSQIVTYVHTALINCACHLLSEGRARRPSDIDVAAVHGLGAPRAFGGPIWAAEDEGLGLVLSRIWSHSADDPAFWAAAPALERAVSALRDHLS